MSTAQGSSPHDIVFGLSREEDERSLAAFLQLYSRPPFATDGCIALANEDFRKLGKYVDVNRTPVVMVCTLLSAVVAVVLVSVSSRRLL